MYDFPGYVNQSDHSGLYLLAVFAYLLVGYIVSAEGSNRGWNFWLVAVTSILATPLIAAILYSPYKKSEKKEESDS